jgi:PAS domain S-box-containing protein
MLSPSIDIPWAMAAIMLMFIIMAFSVLISIVIHSRKISESEKKFHQLFDRVFDSLILMDESGRIVDINEAACSLLGYSKAEFCQRNISSVISGENASHMIGEISNLFKTGSEYYGEGCLTAKDDTIINVEVGCTIIKNSGGTFALASFRDTTYRRQMEADLRAKNIALKEILANIEKEKVDFKLQIANSINDIIIPTLHKVINEDNTVNMVYYDLLRDSLKDMTSSAGGISHGFSNLSPREFEICKMLKCGASSKDIANSLKISLMTVNKHRERIRKKLVISNKSVNLTTFLKEYNT